jgi:hypothetical protein
VDPEGRRGRSIWDDDGSAEYDRLFTTSMSTRDPDGVQAAARFMESVYYATPVFGTVYGLSVAGTGRDILGCSVGKGGRIMAAASSVPFVPLRINLLPKRQYHHLLPQEKKFRKHWTRASLEPHDWTVKLPGDFHQDWVHGPPKNGKGGWWNAEWDLFFKRNPNAGLWDIMDQMGMMMREWGIDNIPIQRYGS